MDGSEIAKRDHQRNKSEIVKLVKEMFNQEKWGDEESVSYTHLTLPTKRIV